MDSRSRDRFVGRTFGTFRIEERLGAGGMGVVYLARDERLRRPVALKMLRPGLANDERRRKRFIREARYAAAIVHPNVVAVYEVGETYGIAYMTMELVPGKNLREHILRGALSIELALSVARDITRALAKAHEQGIVHRDLKPDNVILYEPNPGVVTAKVLDFGLAKALEPPASDPSSSESNVFVTAAGVAVGTAGYMSPEQARGWPVDARSDIYAVGVLLHEMVTGMRPQLVETDRCFTAPSLTNPKATRALDDLVFRCLARDPRKRFADAASLLAALDTIKPSNVATTQTSEASHANLALAKTSDAQLPATVRAPSTRSSRRAARTESELAVPLTRLRVPSLVFERPAPRVPSPPSSSAESLRPFTTSRALPRAASTAGSPIAFLIAAGATMFAACFASGRLTAPALASAPPSPPPAVTMPAPVLVSTARAPLPAEAAPAPVPAPPPVASSTPKPAPPTPPRFLRAYASASASATATAMASASPPVVDCTDPFSVDDAGIRVVRRECLRR